MSQPESKRKPSPAFPNPNLPRRSFIKSALVGLAGLFVGWKHGHPAGDEKPNQDAWNAGLLSDNGFETLFLTWAADPQSTMRIQWLEAEKNAGQEPDPVKLSFRQSGASSFQRSVSHCHRFGSPGSRLWVHRVDLSDLRAGTFYEFQLEGQIESLFFLTAPEKLGESLTFAEGGDVGVNEEVVSKLHQVAVSMDPLFAHVGGDLSYSDGHRIDAEIKYFRQWRSHMITEKKRLIPMIAGIGNHEVRGGMNKTPAEAPYFYALFEGLFAKNGAYGSLNFGDYLSLIMLDTSHTCEIPEQNDFLRKELEKTSKFSHQFVSYHIGAYPSVRDDRGKWAKAIREHWLPLIENSRTRAVFEHHDHAFKRTKPLRRGEVSSDGIYYLGDGDWGKEVRKTKTLEERPYLEKVASEYNVWKVTLKKNEQQFVAVNDRKEVLDSFSVKV